MYVTNQVMPEGYAKHLVNYDVDDTGSCLKPKAGRSKIQTQNLNTDYPGRAHIADYVYSVHNDDPELPRNEGVAEHLRDIVLSFGVYKKLADLVPPSQAEGRIESFYSAKFTETIDHNVYDDETGDVLEAGDIEVIEHNDAWCMLHDPSRTLASFDAVAVNSWDNEEDHFGYITSRTVKNAWAFDKQLSNDVPYPVHAVVGNEIVVFSGDPIEYLHTPANEDRNMFTQFGPAYISRLRLMRGDVDLGEDVDDEYRIAATRLQARAISASEGMTSGFNMLSSNPYEFEDRTGSLFEPVAMVAYKDSDVNQPIFIPDLGEPFSMRIYYQFIETETETMKYKIEYIDTSAALATSNPDWTVLTDWTTHDQGEALWASITPRHQSFTLRVTMRNGDDEASERPLVMSYTTGESVVRKFRGMHFDLTQAKGMVNWAGCVCLYGIAGADDTIFCSVVDDPTYFPFPNNILTFDSEILACYNYLDKLLVITIDSIWLVTQGPNIMSSTMKRVMTNIHIPEIDALNARILKDQIFFKTDTQFFVLKPNMYTSDATDLKNYTNSTAIANFCETFTESVVDLLNKVYRTAWQRYTSEAHKLCKFVDFNCTNVSSHIQQEDVHYVYTIEPIIGPIHEEGEREVLEAVNLHLIYDTMSRAWRIHLRPIGSLDKVRYGDVLFRNKLTGEFYEFFSWYGEVNGLSITAQTRRNNRVSENDYLDEHPLTEWYDNYPYVDSGNVALQDIATKRFRELQLTVNALGKVKLGFHTDFLVDGVKQITSTKYEVTHVDDNNDPDYGSIFVRPTDEANLFKYQSSTLGDQEDGKPYWETADETLSTAWQIDLSSFPKLDTINIRFELRGRGRRGSVQLLNTSLQQYELSTWTWVYRMMTAR